MTFVVDSCGCDPLVWDQPKDPRETGLGYMFDATGMLLAGEAVVSFGTATATDGTINNQSSLGNFCTVEMSGGVSGVPALVTFSFLTSLGATRYRDVTLNIRNQ